MIETNKNKNMNEKNNQSSSSKEINNLITNQTLDTNLQIKWESENIADLKAGSLKLDEVSSNNEYVPIKMKIKCNPNEEKIFVHPFKLEQSTDFNSNSVSKMENLYDEYKRVSKNPNATDRNILTSLNKSESDAKRHSPTSDSEPNEMDDSFQSIYKFAYDANVTDESASPSPFDPESHVPSSLTSTHILIHEAESGSDAGSEDLELLAHRYQSESSLSKHMYVNKLSLAVELLRTQESLPYDHEFKRVPTQSATMQEDGEKRQFGVHRYISHKRAMDPWICCIIM